MGCAWHFAQWSCRRSGATSATQVGAPGGGGVGAAGAATALGATWSVPRARTPATDASMSVSPAAIACAIPSESTEATVGSMTDQLAARVRSRTRPSEKTPVTTSCWPTPRTESVRPSVTTAARTRVVGPLDVVAAATLAEVVVPGTAPAPPKPHPIEATRTSAQTTLKGMNLSP